VTVNTTYINTYTIYGPATCYQTFDNQYVVVDVSFRVQQGAPVYGTPPGETRPWLVSVIRDNSVVIGGGSLYSINAACYWETCPVEVSWLKSGSASEYDVRFQASNYQTAMLVTIRGPEPRFLDIG
jgi:hypothetical protein